MNTAPLPTAAQKQALESINAVQAKIEEALRIANEFKKKLPPGTETES